MAEESECRISEDEASAFAVLAMSIGLPVGPNAFMYFRSFISRSRAVELAAMQHNFRPAEVALIRGKVEDT